MTGPRHHPRRRPAGSYVAGGHPLPPAPDHLSAAVRLELGADAMRAALTGPEPEDLDAPAGEEPLTVADLQAQLAPRVYAAPPARPKRSEMNAPRGLDWASRHDPRSREFDVRSRLRSPVPLQNRIWEYGPILDQGAEGACIGFAAVDAANALELADEDAPRSAAGMLDGAAARGLYKRAQQLDDVPGESYTGTSVLAGMKAGAEQHLWDSYLWCFGTRDLAQAVLQVGPVIIGVPWFSNMYETGPSGRVILGGDQVGGHALAVIGLRLAHGADTGPFFVWQNSWGEGYGAEGLGFIHHRDIARLLAGVGEAAIPIPAELAA